MSGWLTTQTHRPGKIIFRSCFVFFVLFYYSPFSNAVTSHPTLSPQQEQALKLSQAATGNQAGDYPFLNQDRKSVNFTAYRGKPLVVSFIYTSCYHICPMITTNLNGVVKVAREALGEDSFHVITIGFDAAVDSPERLRYFAGQRGIDFNGWDFLSGDAATINTVAEDLGFSFTASAKGFDHLAQTTVLDAAGKVYRQVYGVEYEPPMLVEPLKELLFGKPADSNKIKQWLNGIRLFCTIYDPGSGRYYFDYSIFIGIAIGLLCLTAVAVFIVRSWREHRGI